MKFTVILAIAFSAAEALALAAPNRTPKNVNIVKNTKNVDIKKIITDIDLTKIAIKDSFNPTYNTNTQTISCPVDSALVCCTNDVSKKASGGSVCSELAGASVQCVGSVACCNQNGNGYQTCGSNVNSYNNFSPYTDNSVKAGHY
jgi:hypothetical protein